jgi:adenosylcobinamide-GDP ribazoletransferase
VSFLRQYLSAVQLFTRLPLTGSLAKWVGSAPEALRGSACHWPGVGWLVGLAACAVFALLGAVLPSGAYAPLAAAVASTLATVLLTPAPVASHRGVIVLMLALLLKIALLAVLAAQSPAAVLAALLAGHVLSRFWPLLLLRGRIDRGGASAQEGKHFTEPVDARSLAIAAAWCIVPLGIALLVQPPGFAIMALVFSGLALLGMRQLWARQSSGFDADAIGTAQQACEIAFYLGAAMGLGLS